MQKNTNKIFNKFILDSCIGICLKIFDFTVLYVITQCKNLKLENTTNKSHNKLELVSAKVSIKRICAI